MKCLQCKKNLIKSVANIECHWIFLAKSHYLPEISPFFFSKCTELKFAWSYYFIVKT